MAHRLKKLATARYQPGVPYKPAVVGYCYQQDYLVYGHWEYTLAYATPEQIALGVPPVRVTGKTWVPDATAYRQVCIPSSPAVPGVPSAVTYNAINAWNGGGVSVQGISGNGYFGFYLNDVPSGTVVGLVGSDVSTLPGEASHAFYVHGTVVDIMQGGVVVATCPVPHSASNQFKIARSGTTVTYSYGGWTYTSAAPAYGTKYLDASIYSSGDYVDSPSLGAVVNISASGSFGTAGNLGSIAAGFSSFGFVGRADVVPLANQQNLRPTASIGVAGSVSVVADQALYATASLGVSGAARLAYSGAANEPPPVGFGVGSAYGVLPFLLGAASQGAYSYGSGTLPPLGGEAHGGYPVAASSYAYGILPPVGGNAYIPTGEVGTAYGVLPKLGGLASEGSYGEARGVLPMMTGNANSGDIDPNKKTWNSSVIVADSYLVNVTLRAAYNDGLRVQTSLGAFLTLTGTVMDALMLTGQSSAKAALTALIQSGLLLGNTNIVGAAAATQYAVNVLTGALGTYNGFQFSSFAVAGGNVYGMRADGVYLLRAGDDNGAPISVVVDFGASNFGTTHAKHISALFFGLATDGQIFAKLKADNGTERTYRVIQRGDSARAITSQKVTGRMWNLTLEVADATDFSLDSVEFFAAASTRRWTR